jgi:hypothetical protein
MKTAAALLLILTGCEVSVVYHRDAQTGDVDVEYRRPALADVTFGEMRVKKNADGDVEMMISDYSFEQRITKALETLASQVAAMSGAPFATPVP